MKAESWLAMMSRPRRLTFFEQRSPQQVFCPSQLLRASLHRSFAWDNEHGKTSTSAPAPAIALGIVHFGPAGNVDEVAPHSQGFQFHGFPRYSMSLFST